MMMKRVFTFLAMVLVLQLVAVSEDGKKAPDFTLKTADGKVVMLSALKGKVVIVNFWATWCGPCRKEIPDFMEVYKEYRTKGLEIVGIALDQDGWDAVRPYLEKTPITYPIVIGDATIARQWGRIQYIPTTFVVDKNGNIVKTHTGLMTRSMLLETITPLL